MSSSNAFGGAGPILKHDVSLGDNVGVMRGQPAANSTAFVLAKKLRLMGYVVRDCQEYPGRSAMTGEVNGLVHRDRIEYAGIDCLRRAARVALVSGRPERAGGMLT